MENGKNSPKQWNSKRDKGNLSLSLRKKQYYLFHYHKNSDFYPNSEKVKRGRLVPPILYESDIISFF